MNTRSSFITIDLGNENPTTHSEELALFLNNKEKIKNDPMLCFPLSGIVNLTASEQFLLSISVLRELNECLSNINIMRENNLSARATDIIKINQILAEIKKDSIIEANNDDVQPNIPTPEQTVSDEKSDTLNYIAARNKLIKSISSLQDPDMRQSAETLLDSINVIVETTPRISPTSAIQLADFTNALEQTNLLITNDPSYNSDDYCALITKLEPFPRFKPLVASLVLLAGLALIALSVVALVASHGALLPITIKGLTIGASLISLAIPSLLTFGIASTAMGVGLMSVGIFANPEREKITKSMEELHQLREVKSKS